MKRLAFAPLLALSACTVVPPPKVQVAAPPPTIVPPKPAAPDWQDMPETPGAWGYARDGAGSSASFGRPGEVPEFILRCTLAGRVITLSRPGTTAGAMTIRTSYEQRSWPAQPGADGRIAIQLAAADPFLDKIAFSRGRFSVSDPGLTMLVLPAWAEPARVIEDCRG